MLSGFVSLASTSLLILTRQAMVELHTAVVNGTQRQESQMHALSNALKQQLLKELREDQHEQKSVIKL